MHQFMKVFTIVLLAVAYGCAYPQKQRNVESSRTNTKHIGFEIYSDPPGAHIYSPDGSYWGQTSETVPVRWLFQGPAGNEYNYSVTAKKRGYKTTTHNFMIRYKYGTQIEAQMHYEKLVIVLDVE